MISVHMLLAEIMRVFCGVQIGTQSLCALVRWDCEGRRRRPQKLITAQRVPTCTTTAACASCRPRTVPPAGRCCHSHAVRCCRHPCQHGALFVLTHVADGALRPSRCCFLGREQRRCRQLPAPTAPLDQRLCRLLLAHPALCVQAERCGGEAGLRCAARQLRVGVVCCLLSVTTAVTSAGLCLPNDNHRRSLCAVRWPGGRADGFGGLSASLTSHQASWIALLRLQGKCHFGRRGAKIVQLGQLLTCSAIHRRSKTNLTASHPAGMCRGFAV